MSMARTFKLEPTDDAYCSEENDVFKKNQTKPPIIPRTEFPLKEKRIPTKISLKHRKYKVNTLGCITCILITTISVVVVSFFYHKTSIYQSITIKFI